MDPQSFIQSGLLESYALGSCTPEEQEQVVHMLQRYPEVRDELSRIEASLAAYADAGSVQPPTGVKAKIMAEIAREASEAEKPEMPETKVSGNGGLRLFQLLAFALTAGCAFLIMRQRDISRETENVKQQYQQAQQALQACGSKLEAASPVAELLCDPATQRIVVSDGKGFYSLVYYNPVTQQAAYDPVGLPPAPDGKFYQFWAIVDGKPVDLGMAATAKNLCGSLRTVANAQAFAFSTEDTAEGSAAPTTVVASGKNG